MLDFRGRVFYNTALLLEANQIVLNFVGPLDRQLRTNLKLCVSPLVCQGKEDALELLRVAREPDLKLRSSVCVPENRNQGSLVQFVVVLAVLVLLRLQNSVQRVQVV